MIHWMLFSTLATALFYGIYCLAFRRDRWLQLSRWYLMAALLFSLVYPLVRFPDLPLFAKTPVVMLEAVNIASAGNVSTPQATVQVASASNVMLFAVYLSGATLSLILLSVQTGRLLHRLRRMGWHTRVQLLDDDTPPYSFFSHIIIGTREMSDEELQCVLAHEQEHVRLGHTMDVLLMRLMCCAAWFNPFAWLMLRELRAVHEYQADVAVQQGKVYLRLLYRQATGIGYGHITNKFNSINIKNRIVMMNKQKSRFGAWKALAVLPVAAALMAFGGRSDSDYTTDGVSGKTLVTVNYHKAGAKKLPFIRFGYLSCHSKLDLVDGDRWEGTVTCQGEGWGTSYNNWELSDFFTSKGKADGRMLNRYEKRLLKDVDRQLDKGLDNGSLACLAQVKAEQGDVDMLCTATWENGTANGDADIVLCFSEVVPAKIQTKAIVADSVYDVVEVQPEFPGGMEALFKYLAENISYPEQAKKDGVQGRVFVRFIIEADGSVTGAKVLRGIGGGCDEEAMRVVEAMPKWKPGMQSGKPVRVQFNLPITFKLYDK